MSVERVTITALYYGQKVQNVLNFENPDGGLTPLQVCTEIKDNWIGSTTNVGIHAWVGNHIQWVQVACQTRASVLPAPTTLTIAINGQQSGSNQEYSPMCIILKFSTAIAGRRGRGRSYIPGILNGFSTNGLVNSTFHSFADTALNALNARYKSGGSGPITLLVGPRDGVARADYLAVTNIQASTFFGVQRRRNIGFGI